eukprot:m.233269 g.233269  ORF g.233269 m.233269 type:complete len:229 (-) comp13906_c2_seq3:5074-5760(-)
MSLRRSSRKRKPRTDSNDTWKLLQEEQAALERALRASLKTTSSIIEETNEQDSSSESIHKESSPTKKPKTQNHRQTQNTDQDRFKLDSHTATSQESSQAQEILNFPQSQKAGSNKNCSSNNNNNPIDTSSSKQTPTNSNSESIAVANSSLGSTSTSIDNQKQKADLNTKNKNKASSTSTASTRVPEVTVRKFSSPAFEVLGCLSQQLFVVEETINSFIANNTDSPNQV